MIFILHLNLPILTVFLPFILAIVVILLVKKQWETEKQLRLIIKLISAGIAIMFFLLGSMLFSVLKGEIIESIFWPQMIPFELSFRVDGFSISMAILSLVLWSAVFIYSISYIKKDIIRYYSLLLLALGVVQDTFFATDLVNFYVFLEMTTIVTYFLIIHDKDLTAIKAGYKYLLMSITGAFLILLSILFAYQYTGSYELTGIVSCGYPIAPILFMVGCFVKAGAVPLHIWLPDAHPAAPSPISAFLSGIMIKVGAYGIIRVTYPLISFNLSIVNIGNFLSAMIVFTGIISMLIGVFLAFMQTDVKRLLAYHSVSQMGYILLGIGLGTKLGLAGGLYHLINHATFKSLLFLGMGAVIYRVGSKKLADLGGLWRKMPITATTCIIAALSISGIPPFNGFASKMLLGKAAGEFSMILKYILTLASAFTFASFLKLILYSFFGKEKGSLSSVREAPVFMLIPMVMLSIMCIILGLQADSVLSHLIPVAINKPNQLGMFPNITFWTGGILYDTILTVILGLTVYAVAVKVELIGKEEKIRGYKGLMMAKPLSCLSMNSFYCYLAVLVESSCQKLNKTYSRDLNMHLSWIALVLVVLYLILFLNIV